ncbi:hypothetical protein C8F04DRAFT_1266695 [Mycena alexandri]|uniref:Uncharacterized protein n=1 Tax=Mycena alexandri TaxID=1745969 RepID=A0AAD6SKC1_9AGAR|nr:hypothetical protein C8F04DRAFT_1266695 [Mycena alexandri]
MSTPAPNIAPAAPAPAPAPPAPPRIDMRNFVLRKQSKNKKGDDTPKPRLKPGNKGDFHGKRYDFLVNNLEGYLEASKKGKTRTWWPGLFEAYWSRFHWRLALDEEPADDAVVVVGGSEELTAEEEDEKAAVQKAIKSKIKTWYNHHRNAMGLTSNPFTPWLARLRQPEAQCPKRVTDYQFYMQHDDFKTAVDNEFQTRYWDQPREQHLALRCKVAREFFEAEPEDVKKRIRDEAREEHEEQVSLARIRFSQVVAPLLHGLRAYTGYHITLIAGRLIEGDGDVKVDLVSVHAGKSKSKDGPDGGKDWTQFDEVAYKDVVLDQFVRFIIAANAEPSDDNEMVVSQNADPTGPVTGPANAVGPPAASGTPPAASGTSQPAASTTSPPAAGTTATSRPISSPTSSPAAGTPSNAQPAVDEMSMIPRPETPPPAGSLEGRMAALRVMESPLRRELERLDVELREKRVAELEGLSAITLQRENNLARHREGAKQVSNSVVAAAATAAGEVKKPKARGRKKANGRRPAKRQKRAEVEEEESAQSSASDADNDNDSEGDRPEPPQTRGRARSGEGDAREQQAEQGSTMVTIASKAGGKGGKNKATSGEPKWALDARALLEKVSADGSEWAEMVDLWWKLESSGGFAAGKPLATKGRPAEVGWWIQRARRATPMIKSAHVFATSWISWWIELNPKWRGAAGSDKMLRTEGQSGWDGLKATATGVNGLLSVLMCLKWWKDAIDDEEGDWAIAVSDVTWVLRQLLKQRGSSVVTDAGAGGINGNTPAGAGGEKGGNDDAEAMEVDG